MSEQYDDNHPKSVQALAKNKTEKLELWTLSVDRFVNKSIRQQNI